MMNYEANYASLVMQVLDAGQERQTRNHPTRSIFGTILVVDDLVDGNFPILSGRKMFTKGIFGELAAMLKGPKHITDFEKEGCNYWKKWAKADGSINVDYGNKWLDFHGYNQLEALIDGLKSDPYGRRHIITGWDPSTLDEVDLPCCHILYQWYVTNDGYLEMAWYQRSVDTMVGLPSDVAFAAAWNIVIAKVCGYKPGKLTFFLGDTHIYTDHLDNAESYLNFADEVIDNQLRYKRKPTYGLLDTTTLDNFTSGSLVINDYAPVSKMKFEVHE